MSGYVAIDLQALRDAAQTKGRDYLGRCLAAGEVRGKTLRMPVEVYESIRREYAGWGDKLHATLKPVTRWLDRVFGTRLQTCGGCLRRAEKLNQLEQLLRRAVRGKDV